MVNVVLEFSLVVRKSVNHNMKDAVFSLLSVGKMLSLLLTYFRCGMWAATSPLVQWFLTIFKASFAKTPPRNSILVNPELIIAADDIAI